MSEYEETDSLTLAVAKAIHDGLGGNGWAYMNYGGDEWNSQRDNLVSAALAAIKAYELHQALTEEPDLEVIEEEVKAALERSDFP